MGRRVPVGHPDFGEVFPCRCQEQQIKEERKSHLERYSNLGPLGRIRFEDTYPNGRLTDPESRRLFRAAFDAATSYAEEPQGWLALTGPSGSGKTHLAAAIANRCIQRDQTAFFVFVPDFLDHLRSAYSPDSAISYDDLFQQVRDAPILVLDDLGSHSSTPWAQEKLFQVFNHRFNALLPTVITLRGPIHRLEDSIRTRVRTEGFSRIYSLGEGDMQLLREVGGLGEEMLKEMTFENFKVAGGAGATDVQQATLKSAYNKANSFANAPNGWLLLAGANGCGKTHLAVAIVNERLGRREPAFFAFVPTLLDHLRAAFRPDSPIGYDELFEQVKTTPLLVLDDLGAENSTPWAEEKLYQIVVHRQNARLPTVITTNFVSMAQLDEAKPRIKSRLRDYARDYSFLSSVAMNAPDYRDPQSRGGPRG